MGSCCVGDPTDPDSSEDESSISAPTPKDLFIGEIIETGGSHYVIDSVIEDKEYIKCHRMRNDDEKSNDVNTPNEMFLSISQLKYVTFQTTEAEKLHQFRNFIPGFEIEDKEIGHSTITINESEQDRTDNDIAGDQRNETEDADDSDASGFECVLVAISLLINYILLLITFLHIIVSTCIMACFSCDPFCCPNCKVFMNIVWGINAITTAVIVSYYGFIYSGIYNEYQPWMYAYVSWIAIIWIQFILDVVIGEYSRRKLKILSYFQMRIVGITMTKKKRLYEDRFKDHWMVAISSMLPAMVVFFVASYLIEEKFVLKCSASLESGDICYNDGKGCCVVVSSHDLENATDFLSRLASHMLAIFGIIRLIAWFMLSRYKEIKDIARKSR